MDKSKLIEKRLFYQFFSKSYIILMLNILFVIALLPILLFAFMRQNLLITVIKVLTSFTYSQLVLRTLFQTSQQIVFDNYTNLFKSFVQQFKQICLNKLKISFCYSLLFSFIGIDIYFVVIVIKQLVLLPLVLSIFMLIWSSFINYMLNSQNESQDNHNFRLVAHKAIKRIGLNVIVLMFAMLGLIALEHHIIFTLLFCPALFACLTIGLHRHFDKSKEVKYETR